MSMDEFDSNSKGGASESEEDRQQESGNPDPARHRIDILKGLLEKHKADTRYLKAILDEIQLTDIKPRKAEAWTSANLRSFLKTNFPDEMAKIVKPRKPKQAKVKEKPAEKGKPANTPKGKRKQKTKPEEPEVKESPPPEPPSPTVDDLLDDSRPKFLKLTRTGKSVRLSEEIVQRVEEKLTWDAERVGDSLANVVELLLWHYLGCPEDLLWRSQIQKKGVKGRRPRGARAKK